MNPRKAFEQALSKQTRVAFESVTGADTDYRQMTLAELAQVIRRIWGRVNYAAAPYLEAMMSMDDMDPKKAQYMSDSGVEIVLRFLGNASSFRGPEAKEIKAELKRRLR